MYTFAQKPKAAQQATAGKPAVPARDGQAEESAILHWQRAIGNQAVQRMLQVIQRQPGPGSGASGTHTITDPSAILRDGPPDFKPTKGAKPIPVGTRVDVVDTQTAGKGAKGAKGTFVQLAEHGTGNDLGWTADINLGDVQYANAAASFVYEADVKPRKWRPGKLPVLVYLPKNFDGKKAADVTLYFHGDAANFTADKANNYSKENPGIGMNLQGVAAGASRIVIAPQVNEPKADIKSPWDTLQAGDYESLVQTVFTNLQEDLKLTAAIPRGSFSIAGHSGGGKALGQAALDLDPTGGGVTDVSLVDAGYGGGESKAGVPEEKAFATSFQRVRDWLLVGKREKVLRVLTKAPSAGFDTRHAIENRPKDDTDRIPVLSLAGVQRAIKAKGLDADLEATSAEVTDTAKRTGGMQLLRKIVVRHKSGGKEQGTIYVFLMSDPPRDKDKVDPHFGLRNASIGDIVSGGGRGDDFGATP
ncbi:MAG TPA: hypothetical protein VFE33_00095 [Thermoanaerobaculia bacterium]|nr:hypothetical protein [Thermoanaerobaculia bacterium]